MEEEAVGGSWSSAPVDLLTAAMPCNLVELPSETMASVNWFPLSSALGNGVASAFGPKSCPRSLPCLISGISGCPWALGSGCGCGCGSRCGSVAVAAVCKLLEEFKIVFAEANLLNKQKPQSQELSNGDGDGSGRRGQ